MARAAAFGRRRIIGSGAVSVISVLYALAPTKKRDIHPITTKASLAVFNSLMYHAIVSANNLVIFRSQHALKPNHRPRHWRIIQRSEDTRSAYIERMKALGIMDHVARI